MREPVTSMRCIGWLACWSWAYAVLAATAMPPANIRRTERDKTVSTIILSFPVIPQGSFWPPTDYGF
jgi:hypothetical protein